jgi:2-hydroxychromene-2-carboxylate isomerase
MSAKTLEFWLGYGSTYSYLSVMRIERAIDGKGIPLAWKPFNLTVLMHEKGLPTGPFVPRPEKMAYMWRDVERRAQLRGLFGSPHFVVGDELFWGDDRLEDAIEWCVSGRLSPGARS